MRILIALSFALSLAACGSKAKPAPPEPAPTGGSADPAAACNPEGPDGTPATAEQCECMGLQVVGDIGDGQVKCPDGSTEVSRIRYGIEGGVCCQAGGADTATPAQGSM